GKDIHMLPGLKEIADKVLANDKGSYDYPGDQVTHLLNVRFLPEINWYVFVERIEDEAIADVRDTLFINLVIALAVTVIVVVLVGGTIIWYQRGLEKMAQTDKLTGLVNRQAFDLLLDQGLKHAQRARTPLSLIMLDIDHFKSINDKFGHLTGDKVIQAV